MADKNIFHQPQLTPTLLVDCKLTWKKLASFMLYGCLIACLLYIFGFKTSFFDALLFCSCAAGPVFLLLLWSNSLPKPAAVTAMLLRLCTIQLLGSLIGAVIFTAFTEGKLVSPFNQHIGTLLRMLFLNAFFGSSIVFFFKTGESISEAKQLIMEERLINLDMKSISVEMELKLLQAQIEPHFLFNTLSNVMSLIDTHPDKAKGMLDHFCNFLRGSLHIARDTTVPISQEMDLIRNYLEIQKLRMGDRLSHSIDMPDALLSKQIPPLLIQPLVENSIKHGLEPKLEGGSLIIKGEIDGDMARIAISDSGRGISESSTGNGVGLENVRKRIRMFSASKGKLTLEENLPCGVLAMIEVPL
ncbi:Histidine kinase [Trichlorobacter thiogenes]|uniref:Histidine kinase n=1 Tax=Trichlorobacter thiogenes TaxID=115783 RepID=A0A1T4M7D5_9BACT|nr:histidine kinase [Trichlorobacter thiogenes]SJZ62766.1 Histidine kinase [Trichlorobacter thiogenes]